MATKKKKLADPYPWLALLDLENASQSSREPKKRSIGRPTHPFKRRQGKFTVTPDQMDMIDDLLSSLSEQMGKSIQRGQLFAYMTIRLLDELQEMGDDGQGGFKLPESVTSFTALAEYLDRKK